MFCHHRTLDIFSAENNITTMQSDISNFSYHQWIHGQRPGHTASKEQIMYSNWPMEICPWVMVLSRISCCPETTVSPWRRPLGVSPASSSLSAQRACPHALFTYNNERIDERTRMGILCRKGKTHPRFGHEGPEGKRRIALLFLCPRH